MKRVLRTAGFTLGFAILFILGFLVFSMITEYRPAPVEKAILTGSGINLPDSVHSLTLVTWNIGYGGLGSDMDFFFDGGTRVIPVFDSYHRSSDAIRRFLGSLDSVDLVLIQELDRKAKRSFEEDQLQWLTTAFPDYSVAFAWNYRCRFVPMPLGHPMGYVHSGQATCSRFVPSEALRMGFDRHPGWPERLFYLKRCFLALHYPIDTTHQLVIVNIHNSAFDSSGKLREREIEMLSEYLKEQFSKGNFVVAGGDWNANPPGYHPETIATGDVAGKALPSDLQSMFPGWFFLYDPAVPSNRNVDIPYSRGKTITTVVDFFLVSPNVTVDTVYTLDLGFAWTDHQPVFLKSSWP